ncbi:undecaprenyl diphosphate synthase family protein [Streptomyces acidiscabies]
MDLPGAQTLHGLGVQVRWCGRRDRLDTSLASAIALVENMTYANDVLTLTLCVDYGGRRNSPPPPARWPPKRSPAPCAPRTSPPTTSPATCTCPNSPTSTC